MEFPIEQTGLKAAGAEHTWRTTDKSGAGSEIP
jgi:hypothetical protein